MSTQRVLKVPADEKCLPEVLKFVGDLLEENGCSPKLRNAIRISMEELFVNIVLYAYPEGSGWAELRGSVEDGVAHFQLLDGGTPYDPLSNTDPDISLPGEERDLGGLGILMVKKQMDGMTYEYRDGCNILSMWKRL